MPRRFATDWMRYTVAVAATVLAVGFRLVLNPVLGDHFPFAINFFAVVFAAWYGGFGPALAATLIGVILTVSFLSPPGTWNGSGESNHGANVLIFVLASLATSLLGGAMRRARLQATTLMGGVLRRRDWLRTTFHSMGDGVIVTDREGRVALLNPVAERLTGWTSSEANGLPLAAVFHILNERTGGRAPDPVARVLHDGVVVGLGNHTLLVARDGSERPIEDSAAPIRDAAGNIAGVVLIFRDVSDRRRAERELTEQRQRLHVTLASIGDAVIATDVNSRVTLLNPAAETLTGWSEREANGRPLEDVFQLLDEQTRQPMQSPAVEALRQGATIAPAGDAILEARDGKSRLVSTNAAPIQDAEGNVLGVILIFRDVTERRRAERERRILAAIVESSDDAIYSKTLQGIITSWNSGAERFYGYSAAEIVGKPVSWLIPPEKAQELSDILDRLKRGEGVEHLETTRLRKDGTVVELSITISPMRDANGRIIGASSIARDISRHKQAAEANRQLNRNLHRRIAEFQTLLDVIPIGIAVAEDAECRRVWVNPVLAQWLCLPPGHNGYLIAGEADSVAVRVCQDGRDLPVQERPLQRAITDAQELRELELELVLADGTQRQILGYAAPLFDEHGRVRGAIHACVDVTRHKQLELDLHRTADDLKLLADASATLAALVDFRSTLQKVARLAVPHFADWCAVDMLGPDGSLYRLAVAHVDPAKVALAHEIARRWHPDSRTSTDTGIYHILRTGQPELISCISDELLVRSVRDPELLRLLRELGLKSYMGVPLAVRGKTLGVITFVAAESGRRYESEDLAVAQDLAHRAATAIENARLYSELREADRRKDEFLAILAHELRNPLAPIRTSLHLLRMPTADASTHEEARDVIERQVQQLVRLVDDLLDLSRIVSGKIELRPERVELAQVVSRAVETAQPVIDAQGHQLTVSLSPTPITLVADPLRLAQVLGNLLANAAKYTEHGGRIWLTAELDEANATAPAGPPDGETPHSFVIISVRDTGIGIPENMLSRIFDLFTQAQPAAGRSQGGLGIGLTLVRSLVEQHGGKVEARSAGPGQGSEFLVRLPVASVSSAETRATPSSIASALPAGSRRILVVDDNVDAARSLAMLLRLEGQDVSVAHDGPTALREVEARQPEVIILDIGMPGMDGYEVARRLRQRPGGDQLALIALTGWGQEADRRRSREAGFNHHLVKPIELNALHRLLAGLNSNQP